MLDRPLGVLVPVGGDQCLPLQIREIGINAEPGIRMFGPCEAHLQRLRNALGDLVLHRKDVRERAVEAERPDVAAGACVDELCSDTYPLVRLLQAAFEQVPCIERAADLSCIGLAVMKNER